MSYDRGDLTKLRIEVRNAAGDPADPDELTLTLDPPSGERVTRTWPTGGGEIVRESLGVFYSILDLNTSGSWDFRWEATGAVQLAEEGSLNVNADDFSDPPGSAGLYATPKQLRGALQVDAAVLPDDEAIRILTTACDLIDERLGVREIDEDTGRKVDVSEDTVIDAWRLEKLRRATLEFAAAVYNDPGVESRQRTRFTSGDVSVSGAFGPAYGERAEALLNQSGLRVNRARMSGAARRTCQ